LRRPRNEEEEEEEEEEEDLRCSDRTYFFLSISGRNFLCDEWNEGTRRKNKNVR